MKHTDCAHNTISNIHPQGDWGHCSDCGKRLHNFLCGAYEDKKLRNKEKDCLCDIRIEDVAHRF